MRGRVLVACATLVALTFSVTGCTEEREITPEQVAAWNAEAARLFPNLDVEITGDSVVTMAHSSNMIDVDVVFNDYEDLTSTEAQFAEFVDSMKDAGYGDNFSIIGHAAERSRDQALATALSTQATRQIHDAVSADVNFHYSFLDDGQWDRDFYLWIDVADTSGLSLARLEKDAEITHELASGVPHDRAYLAYSDASNLTANGYPEPINVRKLAGVGDAVDGDCLRTDDWALEFDDPLVRVYPADDPQGACA